MADDLYALPPGEFTRARDERAKALRKEGKRQEADAVKALRKPTVAAWALNQLAQGRPKDVERLVAAGEELRAAQDELLAGGDRKAFQAAAAREREEVAKLADAAVELIGEAGERASAASREKIAETLHAAALDEETAEELRAGRLVREREAIGGFGGMAAAASGAAPRPKRSKPERQPPKARTKSGKGPGEDAKRRAEAERREAAERRQRLAAARTDERHARRELEAAAKATAQAETRADAATAHAEEANARAKVTADRLKETRREQAAAKKAHARAERALADAERDA